MDKSVIMEALKTINKAILEKNDNDTTAEDFYWWNAALEIFDCRVNRCGTIVPGPWMKDRTVDQIRRGN